MLWLKDLLVLLFVVVRIRPGFSWVSCHKSGSMNALSRPFTPCSELCSTPNADDNFWDDAPDKQDSEGEEEELSDEELEATLGDWDDRVARLNTVHLVGRVGNSPEPRHFDDGKVVVNLSLACKRKYHYLERQALGIKSGEDETDWYGLEIWGQTAEFVNNYVDKGARVGVIGNLQVDQWTDKATGEPRSKAKVVVREFDILESKAEADLRRSNQRGPSLYASDDDDTYNPSAGGAGGGFFD